MKPARPRFPSGLRKTKIPWPLKHIESYTQAILMTWGGLRGGVSIALALSVPDSRERDLILVVTYVVVVFSILVQGLSLERLVSWAESRK